MVDDVQELVDAVKALLPSVQPQHTPSTYTQAPLQPPPPLSDHNASGIGDGMAAELSMLRRIVSSLTRMSLSVSVFGVAVSVFPKTAHPPLKAGIPVTTLRIGTLKAQGVITSTPTNAQSSRIGRMCPGMRVDDEGEDRRSLTATSHVQIQVNSTHTFNTNNVHMPTLTHTHTNTHTLVAQAMDVSLGISRGSNDDDLGPPSHVSDVILPFIVDAFVSQSVLPCGVLRDEPPSLQCSIALPSLMLRLGNGNVVTLAHALRSWTVASQAPPVPQTSSH